LHKVQTMRLSQLYKEFNLGPEEVQTILSKADINLDDNPNSKVPDEAISLLKEKAEKNKTSQPKEEDWSKAKSKKEEPEEVGSIKELLDEKEIENNKIPEDAEHIEADVPEITGPKVLDKIDLPDYIEKEKELREKRKTERREKELERKKAREERMSKRRKKQEKSYMSDEERESRERKRRDKARKKREAQLKEQRRKNYLDRVEHKAPQPKALKSKNKKENIDTSLPSETPSKQSAENKSVFAKFFRWLYHGE